MRCCNFFWKILRDTSSKSRTAEFSNDIAYLTKLAVCLRYLNKSLDSHENFLVHFLRNHPMLMPLL